MATNPVPSVAYPTPVLEGYLRIFFFFFDQNDRKGYKRDHLDARGRFVLRFGAIADKPLGGGNHPFRKTRVKNCHIHNTNLKNFRKV